MVDLSSFRVTNTIDTGLHPTGMAFWGKYLLVTNTYSDSISVIDTVANRWCGRSTSGCRSQYPARRKLPMGPARTRSQSMPARTSHTSPCTTRMRSPWLTFDSVSKDAILGLIPTAYAPSSVVLDKKGRQLIVANDKGIGTKGIPPQNSFGTAHGVTSYQHPPGPWHGQPHPIADCRGSGGLDAIRST